MKRLFWPILAVLLSVSCIDVEDFAGYWDKGVRDPALEGRWTKIGLPGEEVHNIPGSDTLLFVNDGRSYSMQMINPVDPTVPPSVAAQRRLDNELSFTVRSLKVGRHSVLMLPDPGQSRGRIVRYEVEGPILREYALNTSDAFEARLAGARNFVIEHGTGTFPVIKRFDDEVFRILSGIADDPAYWDLTCEYSKTPQITPSVTP
jgi:hypothetical protein